MNTNYFTGFDQKYDDGLEFFIDNLPHGSGINCDWGGDVKGNSVKISNSFHCMDEWGGYDGYQDFTLIFDKKDFFRMLESVYQFNKFGVEYDSLVFMVMIKFLSRDFVLQFNNGSYKANKYQLRDYLVETIYYAMSEMAL